MFIPCMDISLVICNYNVCGSYSLQGGRSALHYASGIGNYEVVKLLLNNFANVNLLAKVSVI